MNAVTTDPEINSADDFVSKYALLIFDVDALKIGLLIAGGEHPLNALNLVVGTDKNRAKGAVGTLARLGFLLKDTDES